MDVRITGNAQEQQFQRVRRIQGQDALRIAKQHHASVSDFVRRADGIGAGQRLWERVQIYKSISVQPDSRFRSKHMPYGLIDSLEWQTAGFCRLLEGCRRCVGYGWLQKHIRSGENCLHGGFGGRIVPRNRSHIERVGDHQPIETKFTAQQTGNNCPRERRRSSGIGLEGRQGEVTRHCRTCPCSKGGAEGS